jgi:HB1, ASXL, restriction endonuclease HTH domain
LVEKKTKTSEDSEHDLAAHLKAIPAESGRFLAKKCGDRAGELFPTKIEEILENCLDVVAKAEVTVSLLAIAMVAGAEYRNPQINGRITMAAKKTKTDKTKEAPKPEVAETPKADMAKAAKKKADAKPKKTSALDAAAKVLGEAGEPMNCVELIEAMSKKGYWTSPGGATPQATLYSAILREIKTKGKDSRFQKTERGKFAVNK